MDMERNLVYCPSGEMLRQKCIKKNGNIRYANKSVCKHCKNRNKSYKGNDEWKLFFQRVSWKSRVVSVEGRGAGM